MAKTELNTSTVLFGLFGALGAVLAGLFFGYFFPQFSDTVKAISDIALKFLKLCVLPILFSSVVLAISQFLKEHKRLPYWKLSSYYLFFLTVSALFALFASFLLHPGDFFVASTSSLIEAGVLDSAIVERSLDSALIPDIHQNWVLFFQDLIPQNILNAFLDNRYYQVFIVALAMGVALNFVEHKKSQDIFFRHMYAVWEIFHKIFIFFSRIILFVLFMTTAAHISHVDQGSIMAMFEFVVLINILLLIMAFAFLYLIKRHLQISFLRTFHVFRDALLISFVTQSEIAAIPYVIKTLSEKLKREETASHVLSALGLLTMRFGNVFYFCFTTLFVAQFYDHPMTLEPLQNLLPLLSIVVGSIFASLFTVGASGRFLLVGLAFLMGLFNLPYAALAVFFLAIDSLIGGLRSLVGVLGNVFVVLLTAPVADQPKKG